jgi:hypothetical protein
MGQEMKWNAFARQVFEKMMRTGPPVSFRESAERAVGKEAEKNALSREACEVGIEDLVRACLSETPEPFQSRMREHLKRLGIDPKEYEPNE